MPIQAEDAESYEMVIFGFTPTNLITVTELCNLCEAYMKEILNATLIKQKLGEDLVKIAKGETT